MGKKISFLLMAFLVVGCVFMVIPAEAGDLVLPDFLVGKEVAFEDDFNNLDNWIEEDDFEFNKWAITTKGNLQIVDGLLSRKTAGNSGLKLKDFEITDGAVAVLVRLTEKPESGAIGARIHLRNPEMHWCYGAGVNYSTYSYELATWHGKGEAKASIVGPEAPVAQLKEELGWVTVTAVIQGNKVSYYLNGEIVAENEDPEFPYEKGGVFLSIANNLEIDKVVVYNL
ncbi:MAG: DUF1080 domain-containing protein [Firmicutes bacterium]|nr:DUF1080 domain-containing protein [Bacillota bacterium]